jgi:hypothetical protein
MTTNGPGSYIYEAPWAPVSYHIPNDEDREGPQYVGFFYTSDVADCTRRLYWIQYIYRNKQDVRQDPVQYATFRKYLHTHKSHRNISQEQNIQQTYLIQNIIYNSLGNIKYIFKYLNIYYTQNTFITKLM